MNPEPEILTSPSHTALPAVSDAEVILNLLAQELMAGKPEHSTVTNPERRSSPQELARRNEARYRLLVEQIPAVTFMAAIDEGLGEIYVSPQIETLLGYTAEEWVDNPIMWYQRLHPEDKDRWNAEFSKVVAYGTPFKDVYRFIAKNGRVVWIHGEARIYRDENGRPLFIQGIGFDITDLKRKEEELRKQTEDLKRSNRDLEQFAFVASHDLQEPLRKVAAFTELLATTYKGKLDPDADKWINFILDGAERMRALVKDVLAFSRVGRGEDVEFAEVDLNEVLRKVLDDQKDVIAETKAEIICEGLPRLTARGIEMEQVFQNLITNAIKFRNAEMPRIRITGERTPNAWLLKVADNGIGIDQAHLESVFTIFKRLHSREKYSGTGIGLAICKKIVEHHGGSIWVESQVGQGTTFSFTLPLFVEKKQRESESNKN